jgi:hypothetical protein
MPILVQGKRLNQALYFRINQLLERDFHEIYSFFSPSHSIHWTVTDTRPRDIFLEKRV